jgi:hypothetical protein
VTDFWLSSGHHLVDRGADGRLRITDEFLSAYLARPEVVPPEDACAAERALYRQLRFDVRGRVDAGELKAIKDRDARENWRHLLAFRDHLLAHPTLEAAYLAMAQAKTVSIAPIFLNQLVHLILRGILDGESDPYVLRAGEMLFRAQRLTNKDGLMLVADEERVDGTDVTDHTSPLVAIFGDARARDLDVLGPANQDLYLGRSDAHDFVADFRPGSRVRDGLAVVLQRWVAHMLGLATTVTAVSAVADERWRWFVGLDAEGTQIGNALWEGREPKDNGRDRVVALFRMTIADEARVVSDVAGSPVFLILGMTANRIIRMKPQNLLAGLPLTAQPKGATAT